MSEHTIAKALVKAQKAHVRKAADFYPTPVNVTQALMDFLKLPRNTLIWEPASGDGAMARTLERYVDDVHASDLRDEPSIYGDTGVNFLDDLIDITIPVDWIITNPPFNLAEDFIRKALSVTPRVAMLLSNQYWHAERRLKLFKDHPPSHVLPLTWRPAFLEAERGKSPMMNVMWVVWGMNDGDALYRPLTRPANSVALDPIVPAFDFDDLLGEAMPTSSTSCGADHIFGDLL